MNLLTRLPARLARSQFHLPVAVLIAFLQRTPVVRVLAVAEEVAASSRLGAVLKSALAAAASLGAVHSLAGATALVASQNSPVTAQVGTAITPIAFTVSNTINIASWKITGTLPPGLVITAVEDSSKTLTGPGTLDATTPGVADGYGGTTGGIDATTPVLSGVPTVAGNYTVTLQAFEFAKLTGLATKAFDFPLNIVAASVQPPATLPSFTSTPQSVQLSAPGATVTLTAAASGTPSPTLQWNKNGVPIPGATNPTLVFSSVQTADAANYTVTATNSAGSATSGVAAISFAQAATPAIPPSFAQAPLSQTMPLGSTVVFSATATNATSYQWKLNGIAISGATHAMLILTNLVAAQAGFYTCVATNPNASATSLAATLIIGSFAATDIGHLVNVSILTTAGSGSKALTVGATIGPASFTSSLPLVIRAVGPTLTSFGVTSVLADPVLTLNSAGNPTPFAVDSGWGGATTMASQFAAVGAFALLATSKDSAYLAQPGLFTGGYTVQVTSASSASGTVLAEIYDAGDATRTATTPRLTNLSTLTAIDAGSSLTAGFVLRGQTARTLLIRGIGPSLAPFGLSGTMPDPKLELFNNDTGAKISENDNWGGDNQLSIMMASAGAFGLVGATSKDAVLLITLPPGAYSARVSDVTGAAGTAIVEIYEVP